MGAILKALDTSSASTGDVLIPERVSEGIRKHYEDQSPVYNIVRRIPWATNAYAYRETTDLPTAEFRSDGGTLPSVTSAQHAKPTVAMTYLYTTGEVTGPMIAASASLLDAYEYEIELHADALIQHVEETVLTGDSASNANEFDGLLKQITREVDLATVEYGGDGSAAAEFSINQLDAGIDAAPVAPSHILVDRQGSRAIDSLLQINQRFVGETEIAGGFRVKTYNGFPIVKVNAESTALDGTILLPNMRKVFMPTLMDVTFEPLAKVRDSEHFMLKWYLTLAVEGNQRNHAKMTNANFNVL